MFRFTIFACLLLAAVACQAQPRPFRPNDHDPYKSDPSKPPEKSNNHHQDPDDDDGDSAAGELRKERQDDDENDNFSPDLIKDEKSDERKNLRQKKLCQIIRKLT